jgi:hypothetical protein
MKATYLKKYIDDKYHFSCLRDRLNRQVRKFIHAYYDEHHSEHVAHRKWSRVVFQLKTRIQHVTPKEIT